MTRRGPALRPSTHDHRRAPRAVVGRGRRPRGRLRPGRGHGRVLAAAIGARSCWACGRGLEAYVAERMTMGIPLLYPWANRVGPEPGSRSPAATSSSTGCPRRCGSTRDGLAMHGLLAGVRGWRVERHEPTGEGTMPRGGFDFGADPRSGGVPVPARAGEFEAELAGPRLTGHHDRPGVAAAAPVPIAFGYHPYFRLPGRGPAASGRSRCPSASGLRLDGRMLPTGEREAVGGSGQGPLGSRTFDDGYVGGSRRARPRSCSRGAAGGSSSRCCRGLSVHAGLRARRGTTWSRSSR